MLILFVLVYVLLCFIETLVCQVDAQEPTLIRSRVPIIGHGLGLLFYGVSFYKRLREKHNLPCVTVFLGLQKLYIVNDPHLISHVNRSPREINTALAFLTVVCGKLFGMKDDSFHQVMRNATERGSLWRELQELEYSNLEASSSSAIEVTRNIARGLSSGIVACTAEGEATVHLLGWLQTLFTQSTAKALYGPQNPLEKDQRLVESLWTMAQALKKLTMWPWPAFTAGTPTKKREELVNAFESYFTQNDMVATGHSELVRKMASFVRKHGLSTDFAARYHMGMLVGFVINTSPAAFWLIAHIANDQHLKTIIRAELEQVVEVSGDALTVSTDRMRAECPYLMSTSQELLRFISSSTSTFFVHEDVLLNNQILLKKGSILQVASTGIHSNPSIWGDDAQCFKPDRFLVPDKKIPPSANRTFGGGSTLCPGRQVAVNELLLVAALVFHTCDVELATGLPRQLLTDMLSVKQPAADLRVRILRRPGMENAIWKF